MRIILRFVLTLLCITAFPGVAADRSPLDLQQATRINTLNGELLQVSLGDGPLRNTMVSSVSMFYALGMLEAGAQGHSKTLLQDLLLQSPGDVQEVIVPLTPALAHEPVNSDTAGRFVLSNSVWATNGATNHKPFVFASAFIDSVSSAFAAEARSIDFLAPGAAMPVNLWAEQKTHGLIDQIIDDETLQELTWLIINAAYFEGSWKTPMGRRPPSDDYRFSTEGSERLAIDTVSSKQLLQVVDHEDGSVTLRIPFSGNRYHLVVQIPATDVSDVGDWLRQYAIPGQAEAVDASFTQGNTFDVSLRMPVFSYGNRLTLKKDTPATKVLGLLPLFTDHAELHGLVDSERSHPAVLDTKVGLIQQDTRIELDENGVKAAAVTMIGGMIKATVAPYFPHRRIVIDRPFAWSIVEGSSRAILFSGVLAEPVDR